MSIGKCVGTLRSRWATTVAVGFIFLIHANLSAQTVPSPWTSVDIGNPPAVGSANATSGRFTINGSGADIWGATDQFHFVYQQVTGDVDVRARVDSITAADPWSKAGVMIRSSLAPGAAHAYALASAAKGLGFQRRRANGALSYHTSGGVVAPPRWTRLVRTGTTVTAYVSADGATWTTVGSDTIALGATAYIGIAVTSHSSAMTTAQVSQVSVSPPGLPRPYSSIDIGNPGAAGRAEYRNGSFRLWGAGSDIWAASDQFHFVYRQVTGDVEIRARVASLAYVQSWSKAGVMIRESLTRDSRHAIALTSADRGYAFQRRADTGGMSVHTGGGAGRAPGWVRLVRTGAQIDAYRSADGNNWTLMGTDTIPMGQPVYVGLAVTSHVVGTVAEAVFDNLSIKTQAPSPNVSPAVTLTTPASGSAFTAPASTNVSATASDSDGQVARVDFLANNSLIGTDSSAPYSVNWSAVPAGTYTLTATAYDNVGASTTSAPAAVTVSASSNKPPTISLTSPVSGATFTAPASITVSASAADPEGRMSRVSFFANGTAIGTDTTSPYSINWSSVPAGTHSISAIAYDTAGASQTSAPATVTVSSPAPPPAPRLVVFVASTDHAVVTRYLLEVFAAGADPASATPVATSDLGKPTPAANNDITVDRAAVFSALATGNYIATVRAENSSGFRRSTAVAFTR